MSHNNIVLSLGMGVDSTAILMRWLTDPSSRDFLLSDLTILVSQVGDEYPDTYTATEQVVLPLLRQHRVRLVQVARAALTTGNGPKYLVLDDSRSPQRLVRSGPVKLSDELARNGTIAQVSNRRCSLRWKGEVLDAWIADHVPPGFTHVIGYAANESRRIERDSAIVRHGRQPLYPLQRWNWARASSLQFLHATTGRTWRRSACSHCPFQSARASRPELTQRWRDYPHAAADALLLEYSALALNQRMRLFGARTAWGLATELHLDAALAIARQRLDARPWALYDIRRTYTAPSRAMRSVRVLAIGDRRRIHRALPARLGADTGEHGIRRAWIRPTSTGYPRAEHLLVVAPAGIAAKQRPSFERVWDAMTHDSDEPVCGLG